MEFHQRPHQNALARGRIDRCGVAAGRGLVARDGVGQDGLAVQPLRAERRVVDLGLVDRDHRAPGLQHRRKVVGDGTVVGGCGRGGGLGVSQQGEGEEDRREYGRRDEQRASDLGS